MKDGTVWIFDAIEHWNAEWGRIHASKSGGRPEAIESIRLGVPTAFLKAVFHIVP